MPSRVKGTGGTYMKTTDKQKQKMTSDPAYRVEARKGGKMNAGLKAYLAKKKKKKGKK